MTAPVQLRVALAQVDTRVGDISGNSELVTRWTADAAQAGAHVVVFPEMTLTGYPAEDLVLRESFARASEIALVDLAADLADRGLGDTAVVVGYLAHTEGSGPAPAESMPGEDDRPADANPRHGAPRNAAALLYGGEVVVRYYKRHLPNYGVFDEARYFVPGTELPVVRLHGVDVALTVCEDLWVEGGPCGVAGQAGVDLVLSPNASPYERAKDDLRLPLVRRRAAEARATVVYCNQVGGQDELVFDGDSMAVAPDGELLGRAPLRHGRRVDPQVHAHQVLDELRRPAEQLPVGGHGHRVAVEDELVLAADLVAVDDRGPRLGRPAADQRQAQVVLGPLVGRGVGGDDEVHPGLAGDAARAALDPEVLADGQRDVHPVQPHDRQLGAGHEVAGLVEDAVVGQVPLVIADDDLAAVQQRGRVARGAAPRVGVAGPVVVGVGVVDRGRARALGVRQVADDDGEVAQPAVGERGRQVDERLLAGGREGLAQHQVLGRVAGEGHLGEDDEVGSRARRPRRPAAHQVRVAREVADAGVDLGHRHSELHRRRVHASILVVVRSERRDGSRTGGRLAGAFGGRS
ncbi:MAG TPA: nitrilase-related carbon-nitrogen hydrolase, partial [Acidimicrobiales bacterium]